MLIRAFICKVAVVLLATCPVLGPAAAGAAAAEPAAAVVGSQSIRLERIQFDQMLLPDREHAGFGSLLYDANGALVLHDGDKTWLYTTGLLEAPPGKQRDWYGKWVSYVREFNVRTLASGDSKLVLALADADRWAVIHAVIRVRTDLFVAFYSANGSIRAAAGNKPDGPFNTVPGFTIGVTERWEKEGGAESSIESNGAHVPIESDEQSLTMWVGYDSYHVDATAGQMGWAKVRIDKRSADVALLSKHPGNPLPVLPAHYIAARCGGNLAANVRIAGQYVLFYYTRPNKRKVMLTAALSPDPLFQRVTEIVELEPPLGDETVIEKFESYMFDGKLHIIYENQLATGRWGTGIRIYNIRVTATCAGSAPSASRLRRPDRNRTGCCRSRPVEGPA